LFDYFKLGSRVHTYVSDTNETSFRIKNFNEVAGSLFLDYTDP